MMLQQHSKYTIVESTIIFNWDFDQNIDNSMLDNVDTIIFSNYNDWGWSI